MSQPSPWTTFPITFTCIKIIATKFTCIETIVTITNDSHKKITIITTTTITATVVRIFTISQSYYPDPESKWEPGTYETRCHYSKNNCKLKEKNWLKLTKLDM
jgi:hypothetical protein